MDSWDLCDAIDAEAGSGAAADDRDARLRLVNLRGERRYLLEALLRADVAAYTQLLSLVAPRGMEESDYPSWQGVIMNSMEAISEGVAAEEAAEQVAAEQAAVQAAARERVEQEAAAAEARNEASALDSGVDQLFARAFIWSEEEELGLTHRVVGEEMWTPVQDKIRAKSVREFLAALLEGTQFSDARLRLAAADALTLAWAEQVAARNAEVNAEVGAGANADADAAADGAGSEEASTVATDAAPTVEERFARAWAQRAPFVREWGSKMSGDIAALEDLRRRVELDPGDSAVGRLRRGGAASDPMSRRSGDRSDPTKRLNNAFNDLVDRDD